MLRLVPSESPSVHQLSCSILKGKHTEGGPVPALYNAAYLY